MSTPAPQPTKDDLVPKGIWNASVAAAVMVLLGILVVLGIVLSGVTDPQPVGAPVVDDPVTDQTRWGELALLADGSLGFGIDSMWTIKRFSIPYDLSVPGTIEVMLHQISGPPEAAYGISWRDDQGTETIIKLNGNGYLAIIRTHADQTVEDIYTWRPFPHVHGSDQINQIWVTVEGNHAQVRINEEVAADFDGVPDGLYQVSWYAENFEEGGMSIAVDGLRLWAP